MAGKGRYQIKVVVCVGMVGMGTSYRPDYQEMIITHMDDYESALEHAALVVRAPHTWTAPASYIHPTTKIAPVLVVSVVDTQVERLPEPFRSPFSESRPPDRP